MEEIRRLAAESLAAETLLVALLSRFDDHDASIRATINEAFDHATRFLEDRTSTPASPRVLRNLPTRSVLSRNYGSLPLVPEKNRNKRILWGLAFLRLRLRRESDTIRARR
jgi:hypothetical protein